MAPSQKDKLKSRLGELIEKGYIRPSASPWGVMILFSINKDGSFVYISTIAS